MGINDATQRPSRQKVLALWRERNSQRTVKIKPYSQRPNLLNPVGHVSGRKTVRLAGGDLPVGETSETDWYYPTTKAFSEGATTSGESGDVVEARSAPTTSVADRDDDRCGF
jgi:hypothetical protein